MIMDEMLIFRASYYMGISIIDSLLALGLISQSEYSKIRSISAEHYRMQDFC